MKATPGAGVPDPDAVARRLGAIAMEAGALLAAASNRGAGHRQKADGSPTTAADLASEALILARLAERWPDIPVVAEESASTAPPGPTFFLVDPLDGTKDFLAGSHEYAVSIALIGGGRPVAGALAAPGDGRTWIAGRAAFVSGPGAPDWRPASTRHRGRSLVALVSRRHGDAASEACLERLPEVRRRTASSALKFGLVASGEADLYVRCGPTMEWDIAAGDHIVSRAGGLVIGPDGTPPTYGHVGRRYLNGPFAALADPALAAAITLPDTCS